MIVVLLLLLTGGIIVIPHYYPLIIVCCMIVIIDGIDCYWSDVALMLAQTMPVMLLLLRCYLNDN